MGQNPEGLPTQSGGQSPSQCAPVRRRASWVIIEIADGYLTGQGAHATGLHSDGAFQAGRGCVYLSLHRHQEVAQDREQIPQRGGYVMGLDVLTWIRDQPQFKSTIVIVLTSSRYATDIGNAYQLGANAYLVKPADLNALEGMMRTLKDFWLTQNTPPPDYGKWAARETAKS